MFDHLQSSCNLRPGCQVLEIGPGAGQATGPLLDAGAEVLAVEVREEFGSLLRTRFEGRRLEVRSGEFETIDLPSEAFDVDARTEEVASNGKFGPVEHVLVPWTATQTAHELQQFLCSFSNWMALETEVRTDLLEAVGDLVDTTFGGVVDRPFLTAVYTAQRL